MPSLSEIVDVVIGVDTHVETHTGAVVDARTGAVLDELTVPTTYEGYQSLVDLADHYSPLRVWAIEGTGGHGAGLARHLGAGQEVVHELDGPNAPSGVTGRGRTCWTRSAPPARPSRGRCWAHPGPVVTGRPSRCCWPHAPPRSRRLRSLNDSCSAWSSPPPRPCEESYEERSSPRWSRSRLACALQSTWDTETATTATVLRTLARRAQALTLEARELEKDILALVRAWRPDLLAQPGIGPIVAATVLCAWSHPGRIHSEAAFAMLAGTAPIPANSGQVTTRYRLNRHGDRRLNRALHTIVITRTTCDPATRASIERRTAEGKTRPEIRRCLKRYIARDLFRLLEHGPSPA